MCNYAIYLTIAVSMGTIFLTETKPFDLPIFFKVPLSHIALIPMGAMYVLRGKRTLFFLSICLIFVIYTFFSSLGQTFTMTLNLEDHKIFLVSAIISQILPVIILFLYQSEANIYRNLLLQYLELTEDKSSAKTVFISRMSHELRTPLHGLLSSASLLKQTLIDDEQEAYLSTIDSCGVMLLDIVMQILNIVRIESGKFETKIENISLFRLVQEITDSVSTLADQKRVELLLKFNLNEFGFDVRGDQIHLREVLINVIYLFNHFPFVIFL